MTSDLSVTRDDLIDVVQMLQSLDALKLIESYRKRPYKFCTERCRTYDPKAPPDRRAAQLTRASKALKAVTHFWRLGVDLDVPKSRQVFCSWAMAESGFWEALMYQGTVGYIVSENETKSKELIHRFHYLWEHLDDEQAVPIKNLWQVELYVDEFRVVSFMGKPWGSEVHSLPQNISAMRQYGGSWAWVDEGGVHLDFKGLVQAISPAVRKLVCSGTIGNDSWQDRCGYDELRAFDGPEISDAPWQDELPRMQQAA